jgi:hypothetical protein
VGAAVGAGFPPCLGFLTCVFEAAAGFSTVRTEMCSLPAMSALDRRAPSMTSTSISRFDAPAGCVTSIAPSCPTLDQ